MRTALVVVCTVTLAGCGSASPPPATTSTVPAAVRQAQATHEYPSPPPLPQQTSTTWSTAELALRAYAIAYINWNAHTIAADMKMLAEASIDQARSVMELAQVSAAQDYELQRGGIANSGTVESVAPVFGVSGQYVVVTRERTTATATTAYQGLRPAWHVTLARVVQLAPGQWVVSQWQPES